jgi:uncharacterized protein (UPF0332 family)
VPFHWPDYLAIARLLNSDSPPELVEAAGRCAVSRAYYASFGHARWYASRHLGFRPFFTAQDHGRLAAHFKQNGLIDVADDLDTMRSWRNNCDYDDTVGALSLLVQNSFEGAERIIKTLH